MQADDKTVDNSNSQRIWDTLMESQTQSGVKFNDAKHLCGEDAARPAVMIVAWCFVWIVVHPYFDHVTRQINNSDRTNPLLL